MSATGNSTTTAFPVKTRAFVTPISKVSVVVHAYTNRFFIIVSEVSAGSAGTLVEFRKEFAPDVPSGEDNKEQDVVYDIKVLFGVEKPEILLATRVLGAAIHGSRCTDLPILFGFGLKRFEKSLLEEVAETLIANLRSLD